MTTSTDPVAVNSADDSEPSQRGRSAPDSGPAPFGASSLSTRTRWLTYGATVVVTSAVTALLLRMWRVVDWSAPFYDSGDAVAGAAHFRTTMDTGWYESTDRLGAPNGQNYHDFPFSDELHPAVAKVFGWFTNDVGVAFNAYYVIGFVLIGLAATWFLLRFGISPPMTVVLSALYAVAPYHFIRNENHLFLASYYCIPLALGLVMAAAFGLPLWQRGTHRNVVVAWVFSPATATALILVLTTVSGAYYGVFTGILLAAAALFGRLRGAPVRRLFGVAMAGLVLVTTLGLAMLPDVLYHSANAAGSAYVRDPQGTEAYSLKFISLILPAPGHRIPAFAELNYWYNTHYLFPGEMPALGLVAATGFLILVLGVPVAALASARSASRLTQQLRGLSFVTFIAFLTATIGGLSSVVAIFLTDSIRGWNRFSIFIALLALAAVGLLLDSAARRLSRRSSDGRRASLTSTVFAAGLLVIGVFDQSLTITVPNYQATANDWRSTETFVRSLESAVPANSMVFQLPYMAFPETPSVNGVYESDQLLPYLHGSDLRWSGGGLKGVPQSDWPGEVTAKDTDAMVQDLATIGFAGIVVDTRPFTDGGADLLAQLSSVLGPPQLTSPDGRYVFLSLQPAIDAVAASMTPAERAERAAQLTHSSGT